MNGNGILNNIWDELSTNNLTQSDFDTWKDNFLQDQDVQSNVYNYLKENNLTESSGEEWVNNINAELTAEQPKQHEYKPVLKDGKEITWEQAKEDTDLYDSLSREEKRTLAKNSKVKQVEALGEGIVEGKIPTQEAKEEPSKISAALSSLGLSFVEGAKGFENLKEGIQLGTFELINEIATLGEFEMSGVEKQASLKAIRATNVFGNSESYDPIIEKLEENLPEYETNSITEDLREGNYAQAGFRTVNAALRSSVSLVAAATGVGGLVALGASVAGNKFEEEFEADPEKSTGILLANAGVTGATEAAFELVTRGLLKRAGFLKSQGNAKAAKELLQGGAKNIVKNIGFGLTAEGASEAATELTVAFEDYIMLGKELPKQDLIDRLGDAFIVGSFIGGGISSVGEVTKTMPNAKNRAEAILMPENAKQQISKKAQELNELIDDLPNVSPEGKEIVNEKINELEDEIVDLKKESSLLISNLQGEDLINYSKNVKEINKVKNVLKTAKTDSEKNIAEEKYKILQEENVSILKDAKVKVAEKVTEVVKEQIKEAGLKGEVTEMTSDEISNIEEEGFDSKEASKQFGFIRQNTDGSFEIILNKDKPMVGTAAHEFMHAVLFKTIGANKDLQNNLGDALVEHVSKLGGDKSILGKRLEAYGKYNKEGEFERDDNFGEETITIMSESIVDGSLKFEENFFTKIGDIVRRFSQNVLGKEITFDTGRDVYNFVKDYSKSIKEGKISPAILKVAKEGAKGKLVEGKVEAKPTIQMSKEASNNVQRIYEEQGATGAFDIIEEFKPITSRIAERRREAPNFDKELLMSEIEIGERGILDLIKEYKPESGVPLAAYINTYLPSRAIEASRRVLGEEFTEDVSERVDIAAEEVEIEVKAKPKKKKIVLADRLGVTKEVAKAIKKIVPSLEIDKLNFKTLKNKIPEIVGELFGISPKKLISGANITKKELQSAQMFINKNADVLIAMLPEGATASGTATGIPNTLLKAFYTKADRAKMAKTGTKAGLAIQQKNKIKKNDFLETFGIIDGKPVRADRNTSARVLALANQTGKMITNQAVRQEVGEADAKAKETISRLKDGKSKIMFSKRSELLSSYQLGELSKKLGIELTPLIYIQKEGKDKVYTSQRDIDAPFKINNKETGETYKEAAVRGLNAFLETNPQFRDLVQKTMTGGVLRAGFFQTVFEFNKVINRTIVEQRTYTKDPYNKNKFLDKNFVKKTKQKGYKAEQDGKLPLLLDFFLAVENHLKDNPSDIWIFEEMLKDTGKHQNTLTRILAPITAYPINKKGDAIYDQVVVEEHTNPQNQIGKSLLGAAQIGKTQEMWKAIGKSYMQLSLLKTDDDLINDSGYQTSMPDIYYDEIVPRLLDGSLKLPDGLVSVVRLAKSGIDLNNYYLINEGKTIAEFFGVDKMEISIANDQIVKQLTGEIDIKFSKSLNKVNIKPQLKENKILNQVIVKARTTKFSKTTQGMSAWDLDDTLARTKSGVKARIPNPSMTPQPGRKVIFLAGGAGSGKSNVVKQLRLQDQGFKVVNSDISLEWLKKNHGLPTDMKDLTSEQLSQLGRLQHQARKIALGKKMKYQGQGDGVVIDGTGGSLNVMNKQVQEFKDRGYDVQMVFVETSLETALERNRNRKERSLREGIVKKNHEAVQGNKKGFKELFGDNFAEVSTDNLKQNDPMPNRLTTRVDKFTKSYENRRLTAEEFATEGSDILEQGGELDFAEFDQIVEGEQGPLFGKAMDRAKKYGLKNQFILTARPHAAKQAIYEFLKSQGLNVPLGNIITLEDSAPEAKALWMAEKVGEGYNDIYFADDALQNVEAVDNMLEQFDVKRSVQQAKRQRDGAEKTKSKKEKIKSELGDANNLGSSNDYSNIKFSKSHRAEYENTLAKHRPDLVKDKLVSETVDNMFTFIDGLNIPNHKKRKYEKLTTKWLATSNIKLGEDSYKIEQAVELAEKYKEDIFSYRNPNEIIEKYAGKTKAKPTNPKNVKEFGEGRVFNKKHGITVHEVEDTKEGMAAVRKVVDTHFGPKSNPWCIIARKERKRSRMWGGVMDDAWHNWTVYDKSKKYIVFQNGRLSSFYANNQYWDRMDNATDEPVIQIKKGNVTKKVELVSGKEVVIETRTVSKDGNTVTIEIFAKGTDGFEAGTKIVENRVNGKTVKSTRYSPDVYGPVEIKEFGKDGKATASYNFFPDGKMSAVNTYGQPFGDMSVNEVVMKKGDILTHEVNDGGVAYLFGKVNINDKVTEIGWKVEEKNSDLKDVIKTVDGKVRVDLKKVLEVDPDAKGIPAISDIKFSKSMNENFNDILEEVTGIESKKRFSAIKARKRGADKGKFRFFIPPSHEDFVGLLYNFIGKGKEGNAHRNFFEEVLIRPLNRAYRELNTAKQSIANDYKSLNKEFKNVKKKLTKKTPDGDFTNQDAIRVYLWDKHGHKVPGLTKTDQQNLVDLVMNDAELQAYAETLNVISKQDAYVNPTESWEGGDMRTDLDDATGRIGREQFFTEFNENAEIIFSEENLNKIEAAYGEGVVSAIKDILYRTKTGRNRPSGQNKLVNGFMNYLNGSVASTMFFNMRSAVLQQMSMVNFINFADNNVFKAAAAFANQPQYWKDWATIFNSDFMKERRGGIKTDVNGAELAASLRGAKNTPRALLAKLLELGFLPTQIGDNMAIATGGSTFYRNRINTYLKQGLSQKEAESKAWIDFQTLAEATQQSARPDMVSQQQASPLGKVILAFQNVTSQFNRLGKKAFLDIKNRRITPGNTTQFQSDMSNLSRISYYFAIQNLIFYSLQSALFMAMFDDDEEDERWLKKKERVVNGSIDSVLRGSGVWGAVVATLKNMAIKWHEQREKGYNADESSVLMEMLNVSPPLGIKARKMVNAEKTLNYNKKVIDEMETFDIDNPMWSAVTNYVEATTNAPTNRLYNKTQNIRQSLNSQHNALERVLMFGGWSQWNLGIPNEEIERIKEKQKFGTKKKTRKTRKTRKLVR